MSFRGDKPLVLRGEWHGHPRGPQPLPVDGAALKAQRAKRSGERSERLWTHGDDRKPVVTSPSVVHIPYSSGSRWRVRKTLQINHIPAAPSLGNPDIAVYPSLWPWKTLVEDFDRRRALRAFEAATIAAVRRGLLAVQSHHHPIFLAWGIFALPPTCST